ncbi:hypothetical protein OIU76_020506 [Salix suchowensis]|uniref:Uncharacterized protein n=2 Tax=Salix TaxID=40685 RepID=A0A9Q1ANR4_9ROSI|nr:hypothetical protein OIU76_020506 [Salix suchowensis]KAJ6303043.1 hypothetical protein OIU77_017009 [Salix suchowensis]KAJ6315662.1 hypothetical protein OIU78_019016 [Salix suchowensis]KAJ6777701.1 hypothetical protein OIU74_001639 [Salix koriyanagi]
MQTDKVLQTNLIILGKQSTKSATLLLLGDSNRVLAATGGATAALPLHFLEDGVSLVELVFLLQTPNNPVEKPFLFFAPPCSFSCCGRIHSSRRNSEGNGKRSHFPIF